MINPVVFNVTRVAMLSAFSAVISELLGFKLKLYKVKLWAAMVASKLCFTYLWINDHYLTCNLPTLLPMLFLTGLCFLYVPTSMQFVANHILFPYLGFDVILAAFCLMWKFKESRDLFLSMSITFIGLCHRGFIDVWCMA